MTFGVVIISIMFHGLTAHASIKWPGIVTGQRSIETYSWLRGKLRAADAAITGIEHIGLGRFRDDTVHFMILDRKSMIITPSAVMIRVRDMPRERP